MKKSKQKGKAAGKSKKKKSTKSRKAKSPAEVREDISKLVSENAMELAKAVVGEGKKGQLAPTKYLLELAGVFPVSADGGVPTEREESLAETLLRKLNVPTTPVKLNDEDEDEVVVIAAQEKQLTTGNTEEIKRLLRRSELKGERSLRSRDGPEGPSPRDFGLCGQGALVGTA